MMLQEGLLIVSESLEAFQKNYCSGGISVHVKEIWCKPNRLGKLQSMTDEEFAEISLEAAE